MTVKQVLFDFDGVLADTNEIRNDGFMELLKGYPSELLEKMADYVRANPGLSRYRKLDHFHGELLGRPITEEVRTKMAGQYSAIVKQRVIEAAPISGSLAFMQAYLGVLTMALISGSDQTELRAVCAARGIRHYFSDILGSPVDKEDNLAELLGRRGWREAECVYVGDGINDLEACRKVGIPFIGRQSGMIDWRTLEPNVAVIEDIGGLKQALTQF
ncbi:MAG: HAD hydrolase-like protein [Magnetococcales bacterium]|nr:HAD hydrolase-like protein [Magnetococcales bacterium]